MMWSKAVMFGDSDIAAKILPPGNLKSFLLGTQKRVLVEASPVDRIWGIGLAADDLKAAHPGQWRGLNLLGLALMQARQKLAADA